MYAINSREVGELQFSITYAGGILKLLLQVEKFMKIFFM